MTEPLSFEEHTLRELVALRGLVEVALEAAGVAHERRSETPEVRSLSDAVAELVDPALAALQRGSIEVKAGQYRHVVRDDAGEMVGIVDVPLSDVRVTHDELPTP